MAAVNKISSCESLVFYPVKDAKTTQSAILRVALSILVGICTLGIVHLYFWLKFPGATDNTTEEKEITVKDVATTVLPAGGRPAVLSNNSQPPIVAITLTEIVTPSQVS